MKSRLPMSLNFRLWVVVLLAVLPIFSMVAFDYQDQRRELARALEDDVLRMLSVAEQQERLALESVQGTLKVMARADDLDTLDPLECTGLVQRMLDTLADYNNLGAALPDGRVFCSGRSGAGATTVQDRRWFIEASKGQGLGRGEFVLGRISGQPGLVFGYPVRETDGALRTVVFAAIGFRWFDRMIIGYGLPAGWSANLISRDGVLLAGSSMGAQGQALPPEQVAALNATARSAGRTVELADAGGQVRLYGARSVSFASEDILVAIGAPLGATLGEIDRAFHRRVALLALITLVSAALAHLVIHGLIGRWARQVREVVEAIGNGRLAARLEVASSVRELRALEQGINLMAAGLEQREAALVARDHELRRLSMAVEQSPESIVITDTAGAIEYVNDAFVRNTGYAREELIGRNPRILNKGATPSATYQDLWATLGRGEVWRGEFHNTRKDGSSYIELATVAPIRDAGGVVTHYVAVKEDITLRRRSEELVHRLAYYDPLTGLPNRAMLRDRLQHAILASAGSGEFGMVLLLDIDRFKQLNDTRGHAVGDELLRAIARRLRHVVDEAATIARQGDDDFGVIVESLGKRREEALLRAEALAREIHASLNEPYALEGSVTLSYVTHSIGITLFVGRQWSHENLFKQAEVALFAAKEEGRNTIRFFSPQMQSLVDAHAAMENGLRAALANASFRLFYQPQVDAAGRIVGAEALIRWIDGDGRFVSPAVFIPIAEETGLIVPIGQWVLETACAQLAAWQASPATRGLSVAVNVSARQFHQPDFVGQVLACVERHGIDPAGLKLELTESVILGDRDEAFARMANLRAHGLRFALDDFGTGYSSLSYLKRMPLDQLKIDQSFVRDMLADASSATIVRAILGMSASLGLHVVAEGVETDEQAAFLKAQGCTGFQGYLYGRPLPIGEWPAAWLQPAAD
ncbi:EAL domain-containing protein [Thauera sp. JM12B12]|uniref:bifunctional diguanylate cyclase/phosphodiesterase n=1 Tax=Thauera sp. JM12B12 TaxID=3142262 RepID=UPI0031F3A51B